MTGVLLFHVLVRPWILWFVSTYLPMEEMGALERGLIRLPMPLFRLGTLMSVLPHTQRFVFEVLRVENY